MEIPGLSRFRLAVPINMVSLYFPYKIGLRYKALFITHRPAKLAIIVLTKLETKILFHDLPFYVVFKVKLCVSKLLMA